MSETLYAVFHSDGQDCQPFVGIAKTKEEGLQLAKEYDQDEDHDEALHVDSLIMGLLTDGMTDEERVGKYSRWCMNAEYSGRRAFYFIKTFDGRCDPDWYKQNDYFDSTGYRRPKESDE